MGYHLGIIRANYKKQCTEWDSLRYIEDYTFIELIPHEDRIFPKWNNYGGVFKPSNIRETRRRLEKSNITNKERYYKLLSILEKNKLWWVDYS